MTNTNILDQLISQSVIDLDQRKIIEIELYKSQKLPKEIESLDYILDIVSKLNMVKKDYIKKILNINVLSEISVDKSLIKIVPYNFCVAKKCLPISIKDGVLNLLTTQNNINTIKELKTYLSFDGFKLIMCLKDELNEHIEKNYIKFFDFSELLVSSQSNSVELFLDRLFFDAINKKASDIHISPEEYFIRVRYRIDGELRKIFTFHKDFYDKILVRLKILFSVDISKSLTSKDGSFVKMICNDKYDFRASFHYCIYGENVVIRVLNNFNLSSLEEIGYSCGNLNNINLMLNKEGGLVVFVGPTGSGKTTSLYSMLKKIDPTKNNVMTIEDPIECLIPNIQQTDINYHPDATFSSCLRSVMRQDPDCIFIGEIRDKETAVIALRASMTGHKVFTTLHARNIFAVLDRFIEFGIDFSMCVNNLSGIVSQRLVKKICKKCSTGCVDCFYSGYLGRCVISETLFFDQKIIDILSLKDSNFIKYQKLKEFGFKNLYEDGLLFVQNKITNLSQIECLRGLYGDL